MYRERDPIGELNRGPMRVDRRGDEVIITIFVISTELSICLRTVACELD